MDGQTMIFEDGSQKTVIHYSIRTDREVIACCEDTKLPQQKDRIFAMHRSDDPRAVTCPLCKETRCFKKKLAEIRMCEKSRKACI